MTSDAYNYWNLRLQEVSELARDAESPKHLAAYLSSIKHIRSMMSVARTAIVREFNP